MLIIEKGIAHGILDEKNKQMRSIQPELAVILMTEMIPVMNLKAVNAV